ncbi:MAG: ATP-binding protein [Rhodothermaceae bacterium]|nr:ATP-binding protein [Rhodothermaceae bacterium]MXZ58908.1 ATP-binding protein [Rhodothermaceae bacterium]MYB90032.1 ATP-binding protein [Rhodothermaceae bacterium]MYD68404.1 ATP-binding protein [Rhodothermaceae bacterium]MYG43773.1 ATP-binding protein [Rhodothermaceae bacterium]
MHNDKLHLSDLSISNFRGIHHLSIKKLGRVTLITGLNGVGKTTVLEAVRVYATRGDQDVFRTLLYSRDELVEAPDEDRDLIMFPDYSALFFGRHATPSQSISIGPLSGKDCLKIEVVDVKDLPEPQQDLFSKLNSEANQALKVVHRDAQSVLPWLAGIHHVPRALRRMRLSRQDMSDPINCESLGPGLLDNYVLASYWDKVVLTPQEALALEALNLTGQKIDRVAAIGEDSRRYGRSGSRIVVRMNDQTKPLPLKSLGDGITRLFAASLALAVSRDGFLVIDEVENGIHYSVQHEFWKMVLKAAHEYNVQILATTHSFDCIKAFASAATEIKESNGALIRLEGENGDIRAIEYTEEELKIASYHDIEVR